MLPSHFPSRFGPFELVGLLGKGGMARVYDGFRLGAHGIRTRVAVKCLIAEDAEDLESINMFIEEARLNSQLRHANLIAIHDFNTVDDVHYIAMEFVDGCDLKDLIDLLNNRGQRLPLHVVADIFQQLLVGLDYAHSAMDNSGKALGLVHRDLKPANIFITRQGMVKIGDFGVAKTTISTVKTTTGMVKGTPAYLSPEQCKAQKVTPASDLFATGLILYEMLAGHRYFTQDNLVALIMAIGNIDTSAGYEDIPDSAAPFFPLMDNLLEQDPKQRYQTANQALEGLAQSRSKIHGAQSLRAYLQDLWPLIDAQRQMHRKGPATIASDPNLATVEASAGSLPTGAPPTRLFEEAAGGMTDGPLTEKTLSSSAVAELSKSLSTRPPAQNLSAGAAQENGAASASASASDKKDSKNLPLILGILMGVMAASGLFIFTQMGNDASPTPQNTTIAAKNSQSPAESPKVGRQASKDGSPAAPIKATVSQTDTDAPAAQNMPEPAQAQPATKAANNTQPTAVPQETGQKAEANAATRPSARPSKSPTKPRPSTKATGAKVSKDESKPSATSTLEVVFSTVPNDGRVSIDGGAPTSVPHRVKLKTGRHRLTFYCQDYEEQVSFDLKEKETDPVVWICAKKRIHRPTGR